MNFRTIAELPREHGLESRDVRIVMRAVEASRRTVAELRNAFPGARAIICGLDPSQRSAVAAFRAGADDFVAVDIDGPELATLLATHLEEGTRPPSSRVRSDGLVGDSAALRAVCDFALRLAPTDVSVLVTGETGTGKDCLAAMVHRHSRRANGPLVALNCAAIPEALLEGELFGYERGAFSGAHASYPGKLKLADKGTLLLDEIGELSPAGQAKVLRAIETGEAYRLGATRPTQFDIRIVAATNRDLAAEIAAGRFREDLFYRLAVARIEVPPLRERVEDIAPIAMHLLGELARSARTSPPQIGEDALAALEDHCWPGNVRELRNVIEITMVTCHSGRIGLGDLPDYVRGRLEEQPLPTGERGRMLRALAKAGGNKSEAAKSLSCSRMTLYRRLARLGLADQPGLVSQV